VVNAVDGRIPERAPDNGFSGRAQINYDSVSEGGTGLFRIDAGGDGYALHADGMDRHQGNYEIPGGTLANSFVHTKAGAFGGSILGKMVDGQKLLALFALVMIVIALLMLKTRSRVGLPDVKASMSNMPAIAGLGLATGTISGFFGIGGGFLIVPALMLATGMPIMNAVSSSLVAVTAFGLTTAASYAWSGLVSWPLAGLFVAGGIAGGLAGTRSARHLAERRGALNIVFAVVIIAVALYMLARNISLSPA
jgi:uncharacterized membrane protein YfcA